MIDITKLTHEDIGRKVFYEPFKGAALEEGIITSFNDTFIFVDYTNVGRGQATQPSKLEWVTKVEKKCDHEYSYTNAKWQSVNQRRCIHCGHELN